MARKQALPFITGVHTLCVVELPAGLRVNMLWTDALGNRVGQSVTAQVAEALVVALVQDCIPLDVPMQAHAWDGADLGDSGALTLQLWLGTATQAADVKYFDLRAEWLAKYGVSVAA